MSFSKELSCITCSKSSPIFKHLTEEEIALIDSTRIEVNYEKGETIMKRGAPLTHLISFHHGLAKIVSEGKKKYIIEILKPQTFFSGPGLYVDQKIHFTIEAIQPSMICLIELQSLQGILDRNQNFARHFISNSNQFALRILQKMNLLMDQDPHKKVASSLLYLSQSVYNSNPFILTISQQELAQFSGLSNGKLKATLSEFAHRNLLSIDKKLITLLDLPCLTKIAN